MQQELLQLIPKRFLCPYCGKWHEWGEKNELSYYDSECYQAMFECTEMPNGCNHGQYRIYFYDGYCFYQTEALCGKSEQNMKGCIPISDLIESANKPIVTFDVEFTSRNEVGKSYCSTCRCCSKCLCAKLGDEGDNRHMAIKFGFEFDQSDYFKWAKPSQKKEETTMSNIFNMSIECGPNKDPNIASTLMGVAVKNGDSWRIYDKQKKEIIDVGDMQLGNLPIFILPTTSLSEGDLIKDEGEYYFVHKIKSESTQTLCAKTGEMRKVVPIKNILGVSCYSKVVTFSDSLNIANDFDVKELAIMSAMCGQSGEGSSQMNQLLPLIFFKDKLGEEDDMMKMAIMSAMCGQSGEEGGQMNQLLPLIIFKDKFGEEDDTMKMAIMASMMGGGMAGSNPLMGYLMLDSLKSKNEDEKNPQ